MIAFLLAAHAVCGARAECRVVHLADAGPGIEVVHVNAAGTDELWAVGEEGKPALLATGSFDAEAFDATAPALEVGPNRLGLATNTGGTCQSRTWTAWQLDPPMWRSSTHADTGGCEAIRRVEWWSAADPSPRGVRLDLSVMRSEKCPGRRVARYLGVPILDSEDWRIEVLGAAALLVNGVKGFVLPESDPKWRPTSDDAIRTALVSPSTLLVEVPSSESDVELWLGDLTDASRFRIRASDGTSMLVAGAPRSLPKIERVERGAVLALAISLPEAVVPDTTGLTVGLRTDSGTIASSEICNDDPATLGAIGRAPEPQAAFEPLVLKNARLTGFRWRAPHARSAKSTLKEVTLLVAGEASLERLEWETRAKVSELPAKPTDEDWGTDVLLALPPRARECIALLENLGWRERLVVKGKARRIPLTNEVARTRLDFESVTCAEPKP